MSAPVDVWSLWSQFRRRLGVLMGTPDPSGKAMRKAASKLLGRPVNLKELTTDDLATLVVELDRKIAERSDDQLSVLPASADDGAPSS